VSEAYNYLYEICNLNKTRELLAQSLSKLYPEKDDKKRLLPYHMHINVEMIETAHWISVMLMENVEELNPNYSQKKSKFKMMIDGYKKNHFNGYPESYRDYIFFANRELCQGNWQDCLVYLKKLTIWSKISYPDMTLKNL